MPSPSNNPIPVALESLLTDIFRQYEATEGQAKAWLAVSSQLKAGNPELFAPRVTGVECALLEVKRLQQCERELAKLSLAKGKADVAPAQPPAAVPAEPMQANAGPAPGDRPIDRLIAAQPLPKYPYAKPAQPTDADKRDAERWQPIDNAPKDGRHILVWWENEARLAWWLDNSKTRTPWAGWKVPSLQVMPFGSAPTHWMPLPSKPLDAAIAASAKEAK